MQFMLSKRLRMTRTERNLTQDDVAIFLNIKRQTYGAYERGVSIPDALTLNKLASYFNVTSDYLFGKTDNPNPNDEKKMPKISGIDEHGNYVADFSVDDKLETIRDLAKLPEEATGELKILLDLLGSKYNKVKGK